VLSGVPARVPWSDHLVGTVTVTNTTDHELHFAQPITFRGLDDHGNPVEYSQHLQTIGALLPEANIATGQTKSFPVALPWCEVESDPCVVRGVAFVYPTRLGVPFNEKLGYLSNVVSYTLLPNPQATFRATWGDPFLGLADNVPAILVPGSLGDEVAPALGAYLGVLPLAWNGVTINSTRFYVGARPVQRTVFEPAASESTEAYDAPTGEPPTITFGLSIVSDRTEIFALAVTDTVAAAAAGSDPRASALAQAAHRADALARDLGSHADAVTLVAAYPPASLGSNRTGDPFGVARGIADRTIVPVAASPVPTPTPEPTHTPGVPYSEYRMPIPMSTRAPTPVSQTAATFLDVPDGARTVTGRADERIAWPADRLRIDITVGLAAVPRIPLAASKAADRVRARPDVEDIAFSQDSAQMLPIRFEVVAKGTDRTTASAIVAAIQAAYPTLPVSAVAYGAVHDCFAPSLAAQRRSVRAALERVSLAARDRAQRPRKLVVAAADAPRADRGSCRPTASPSGYDPSSHAGLSIEPKPSITIDVPVTLIYRTYEAAKSGSP